MVRGLNIQIANLVAFLLVLNVVLWPRLCKNVKLAIITPQQQREVVMKRFIEGEDRNQSTLFPECLEDYIAEDNPVRVIDVFVDELESQVTDYSVPGFLICLQRSEVLFS